MLFAIVCFSCHRFSAFYIDDLNEYFGPILICQYQISLCRRGVGVPEALLLKEAIMRNPQLCVLKLSYNNLGDAGASIIASSLTDGNGHHHQLSVLDLGFNSIGDVGCGYLALHCLAGNHNLQSLYLSGNSIGEKGALSIAGAILHGTSLQCLYLSANQIGPMGMKTIAGAIAKNEAKILSMCLESNTQQYRSMEVIHFSSTSMESSGFLAIPGMLLSNSSIKSLCVSDNNLDDQDMLLLSQALTQNKLVPLESLQLSFNQITCIGVECLMNALWGSRTLRELKLDNNKIQDRGAQLCAVVLTSISLELLDLSFNKVSTAGIKALMKNLSENSSLRTLSLSGIPIDQNASKAVSYALAYNTTLRALHVDNCNTGYASQRHIVAGAVSNRKSSLRVLTGFFLSRKCFVLKDICFEFAELEVLTLLFDRIFAAIAMTLGMPRLPEDWSNDQVLGFFRLMWDQWLLKSRQGSNSRDEDAFRGPAPPAAVAAAAKIAFTSLGTVIPVKLFQTEQHEKPISDRAPVEPASSALLERSNSGTVRVPMFTVSSEVGLSDFVDGESKAAAVNNRSPSPQLATVRNPLDNPERRNLNLQWLRLHFRALSDIGRLPFNNADLWQLHQYYFSPPLQQPEENDDGTSETAENNLSRRDSDAPPLQHVSTGRPSISPTMDRSISFQTLGDAISASGALSVIGNSNKRRSHGAPEEESKHAAKRPKNLKPRIAYYPRVMAQIQTLGTRPTSHTLALLRQLKFAESIIFSNRNPYSDSQDVSADELSHGDIDMILLDLL